MTEQTMALYLPKFRHTEKVVICAAVRQFSSIKDCHIGMFALLSPRTVLMSLTLRRVEIGKDGVGYRLITELIQKVIGLFPTYHKDGSTTFAAYLSENKVWKHTNRTNTIQGVDIKFKTPQKKVTVGVKWSLGKRDYVPDTEVLVDPVMNLKWAGVGIFQVTVEKQYLQAAQSYLLDNLA
jgi:hypothetical protein